MEPECNKKIIVKPREKFRALEASLNGLGMFPRMPCSMDLVRVDVQAEKYQLATETTLLEPFCRVGSYHEMMQLINRFALHLECNCYDSSLLTSLEQCFGRLLFHMKYFSAFDEKDKFLN